jgi:hypothetical protein
MTTKEKLANGASKEELIQAYISKVEAAEQELIKENLTAASKEEDGKALYAAMKNYLCKYTEITPDDFPPIEDFIDIIDSVNEHMAVLFKVKDFFM